MNMEGPLILQILVAQGELHYVIYSNEMYYIDVLQLKKIKSVRSASGHAQCRVSYINTTMQLLIQMYLCNTR